MKFVRVKLFQFLLTFSVSKIDWNTVFPSNRFVLTSSYCFSLEKMSLNKYDPEQAKNNGKWAAKYSCEMKQTHADREYSLKMEVPSPVILFETISMLLLFCLRVHFYFLKGKIP